jgi:hypothetical protein
MASFAYAHPTDIKGMVFLGTPHAIITKEALARAFLAPSRFRHPAART